MDIFRTIVEIEKSDTQITPQSKLFLCGSCFSINIGQKFQKTGFHTLYNPFGTLYNPHSIHACLQRIINKQFFTSDDFFFANRRWQSYQLHSDYSGTQLPAALEKINTTIQQAHQHLKNSQFAFITLGSAFVFELTQTQQIVANCHKQHARLFKRYMLKHRQIIQILTNIITEIRHFNPQIKIIFTVSPVRHWRDGAQGNQASKARLISALYELRQNTYIHYFPSYEIVMDELRDYRFYADDMLHIAPLAEEYIWKKLQQTFFSPQAKQYAVEMLKIHKALNHIPTNPQSEEYRQFLNKIHRRRQEIIKKYQK